MRRTQVTPIELKSYLALNSYEITRHETLEALKGIYNFTGKSCSKGCIRITAL